MAYLVFLLLSLLPLAPMWGYLCIDPLAGASAYSTAGAAMMLDSLLAWAMAPPPIQYLLRATRRRGLHWADIPGFVTEWRLGARGTAWHSGMGDSAPRAGRIPMRLMLAAPFVAMVLAAVAGTAYLTLENARDDAEVLATRLQRAISTAIGLRVDGYLTAHAAEARPFPGITKLLHQLPISRHGLVLLISVNGELLVASQASNTEPVQAALAQATGIPFWAPHRGLPLQFTTASTQELQRGMVQDAATGTPSSCHFVMARTGPTGCC